MSDIVPQERNYVDAETAGTGTDATAGHAHADNEYDIIPDASIRDSNEINQSDTTVPSRVNDNDITDYASLHARNEAVPEHEYQGLRDSSATMAARNYMLPQPELARSSPTGSMTSSDYSYASFQQPRSKPPEDYQNVEEIL